MTVTYYGIDDQYGLEDTMANGEPFDPYAMTAASKIGRASCRERV